MLRMLYAEALHSQRMCYDPAYKQNEQPKQANTPVARNTKHMICHLAVYVHYESISFSIMYDDSND